jgi:phage terminase large subunit
MNQVQTNVVFNHAYKFSRSDKKILIEQGGSRSGKTFNILIWIIFDYCFRHRGNIVTICRKTFPSLRGTVMRDFLDILKEYDLYSEKDHNKSNSEYYINGNTTLL